jgi:hypothetical protein
MEKYRLHEVVGSIDEREEKKASKLEYKETPSCDLIQYMQPCLKEFVLHNYIARWQDSQFKEVLSNVFDDMVISCIDFSENYTMKIHNKIWNMHWHNFQVNILVHITYQSNPYYDPAEP